MNDSTQFRRHVHDAYAHLYDPVHLRGHPLAKLLVPGGSPLSPDALRHALLDAMEELRPPGDVPRHSVSWRRYRYLVLRYREGAGHEQIARELLISTRQARRDHLEAIGEVGAVLRERFRLQASTSSEPAADSSAGSIARSLLGDRGDDGLAESIRNGGDREEAIDLVEAIAGAAEIAGRLAASLGGRIESSIPERLAQARIDRTVLRQVLIGVLSYAIEREPGIPLVIKVDELSDTVKLTLVPAHVTGTVVHRKSSHETGRELDAEAVALLSVARQLALSVGVDIRLAPPGAPLKIIEVIIPVARPTTILVIDDNADVPRLFERFLAGTSYRIVHAKTWQHAIQLIEEIHPDVITLDVMMPSLDGWDILHRLRSHPDGRDVPVLVCSILPEKAIALAMGAAGFLAKPVTRQALLDAVNHCRAAVPTERRGHTSDIA